MKLTCNQIILLLNIYRGINSSDAIGTKVYDLGVLCRLNLIDSDSLHDFVITEAGYSYIKQLLSLKVH